MSYQASDWARHRAPMLRTDKGRPDTSARAILGELAEHANETGGNSHPAPLHMRWSTGYDERTIERALRRLEASKLIRRTGITREGCVKWQLDMTRERPESDWDELVAEAEQTRQAESAKRRKRRTATTDDDVSGTEDAGHIEGDVADDDLVRHAECEHPARRIPASGTQSADVRHAVPPEPSENHQGTIKGTTTGGAPPPDPRRTEPPTASRTDSDSHSATIHGDQSLPSDHPLGDDATEPPAPLPEPADLVNRPRCPHGRSTRTTRQGQPRCEDCRTAQAAADHAQAEADQIAAVGAELGPARCTPHRLPTATCSFCRRGLP